MIQAVTVLVVLLGVVSCLLMIIASANDHKTTKLTARVTELERHDNAREKREDAARVASALEAFDKLNTLFTVKPTNYDFGGCDWAITVSKGGITILRKDYDGTKANAVEAALKETRTILDAARLYGNLT